MFKGLLITGSHIRYHRSSHILVQVITISSVLCLRIARLSSFPRCSSLFTLIKLLNLLELAVYFFQDEQVWTEKQE